MRSTSFSTTFRRIRCHRRAEKKASRVGEHLSGAVVLNLAAGSASEESLCLSLRVTKRSV
jgi:hypothetical protein